VSGSLQIGRITTFRILHATLKSLRCQCHGIILEHEKKPGIEDRKLPARFLNFVRVIAPCDRTRREDQIVIDLQPLFEERFSRFNTGRLPFLHTMEKVLRQRPSGTEHECDDSHTFANCIETPSLVFA
jgi:hypothetical protein